MNTSQFSENDISNWAKFITPTLLHANLPMPGKQVIEYVTREARWDYNKAKKLGYTFIEVIEMEDYDAAMMDIWNSYTVKQNRPINKRYNDIRLAWHNIDGKWPVRSYATLSRYPTHRMHMFFALDKENTPQAFLELLISGDLAAVHGTMGHSRALKDCAMKFIFIEGMQWCTDRGMSKFYYGSTEFLGNSREHFIKDLGIINK